MKKILIATSSITLGILIGIFMFIGSGKKKINARTAKAYELPVATELEPHEMAASKIKESLVADLKQLYNAQEKFFIEHCSCSPKLLACLLMATKEHGAARQLLEKGNKLTPQQLQALRDHKATKDVMQRLEILEGQRMGMVGRALADFIDLLDVSPDNKHAYKRAGYATYYADKREDFSLAQHDTWHAKQKNIYKLLQEYKPETVLDVGGNSGWFSRLAASCGAQVTATDIDESSIEYQFQAARDMKLPVTPLIHDVTKFHNKHEAQRFESEMVFCLALIHHLVFLSGMTLEEVVEVLGKVTKKVLVLEFIDLDDQTLQKGLNDPLFFASKELYEKSQYHLKNYAQENYNSKNLLKISQKSFKIVKVLDSSEPTRKLVVLSK